MGGENMNVIQKIPAYTSILFFSCTVQLAAQSELIPLDEYLAQSSVSVSDLPTAQYVFVRCAGILVSITKALEDELDPSVKLIKIQNRIKLEKAMELAIKIEVNFPKPNVNRVNSDIVKLANIYTERIRSARLMRGNMFEDKIVKSDYELCINEIIKQ